MILVDFLENASLRDGSGVWNWIELLVFGKFVDRLG